MAPSEFADGRLVTVNVLSFLPKNKLEESHLQVYAICPVTSVLTSSQQTLT